MSGRSPGFAVLRTFTISERSNAMAILLVLCFAVCGCEIVIKIVNFEYVVVFRGAWLMSFSLVLIASAYLFLPDMPRCVRIVVYLLFLLNVPDVCDCCCTCCRLQVLLRCMQLSVYIRPLLRVLRCTQVLVFLLCLQDVLSYMHVLMCVLCLTDLP